VIIIITCFVKNIKYKQNLILAAVTLLIVFSNSFLLNQFAKVWDVSSGPSDTTTKYSCAIVLGGFVSEDNHKNGFLNWAADRYIQGIKLKETGKVTHLLFTGGNASLKPDGFTEGKWISSELKAFHFPDSTLLFEKQSRNTVENIQFSKILLQSRHLQPPYLLVTSAFHMRRALLICKKAGVQVVPYPCNFFAGKGSISMDSFIPSAETLANWNIYLKELVGYAVTTIKS
ncbi:MAG: YdcF family protein, partial [Sphingobacteriaceae bacterium]